MMINDRVFDAVNKLFVLAMLVVVLYPLIYMMSASISAPDLVNSGKMWLFPKGITLDGYTKVFENKEVWIGYKNTAFYTLLGTFINLFVTLPCAYALSRSNLGGKKLIMFFFVFTMFFHGGLIPNYLLVKDLHMLNTVWALVIPSAAAVWNIIVSRTFFQMNIPRELQEAGEVDGCSTFRFFAVVVLPLSMPIVAVMGLFYGVGHWNQYMSALLYISDREMYPLQLFLREILVLNQMNEMTSAEDMESLIRQAELADIIKYSIIMVSSLPLLIIYPFVQRFFVKGALIGSLKG